MSRLFSPIRYKTLGDLPHVMEWPEYRVANPGFSFLYQLINVEDLNGVGESEPTPYFYQVIHMHVPVKKTVTCSGVYTAINVFFGFW